jgi:signal peptidase II
MSITTRTVLLVAGAIVLLDQVTKFITNHTLPLYHSVAVIDGFFHLTHVRNTGAAFGLLAQAPAWFRRPFFLVSTSVAVVALVIFLWRTKPASRLFVVAVSAILGGALGNLIDRIVHDGQVIDFLDVHWRGYHWPTFNVADSAITLGVLGLWWASVRDYSADRREKPV